MKARLLTSTPGCLTEGSGHGAGHEHGQRYDFEGFIKLPRVTSLADLTHPDDACSSGSQQITNGSPQTAREVKRNAVHSYIESALGSKAHRNLSTYMTGKGFPFSIMRAR